MLGSLNALVGMPVIRQTKRLGYVERAVADAQRRRLDGLVIRRGMGLAHWIPREEIGMLGENCVIVHGRPQRMPDSCTAEMHRVFLTTGECAGEVTDAVVDRHTMRIVALEVCRGPLYRLMGQRGYAVQFHLNADGEAGEVVAAGLLSWAQLQQLGGEEEE